MNPIEQPPVSLGDGADEVDVLLRRFYQAEMPQPWPAFRPPATLSLSAARKPRSPWRSRSTLAASVAFLLAGSVWLAAHAPVPEAGSPSTSAPTEASNRKELRRGNQPRENHVPAGHGVTLPATK